MKLNKIFQFATIAVASATLMGVTSCNYLDVVPPEQPGLADAMKNHTNAEGFLYSCYNGINQREHSPRDYRSVLNASTDEHVIPEIWYAIDGPAAYSVMRNTQTTSPEATYDPGFWDHYYNAIGQTLLFDRELKKAYEDMDNVNNVCVDDAEYKMWKAESQFCRAYYHYCLLELFGPIPITKELAPLDINMGDYPGRTHFDGCVDWIVNELDEAIENLPETRDAAQMNRATKIIAKSLKARLLLYAASDLWNGGFPSAYRTWQNKVTSSNPVTGEDYGREIVSRTFKPEKWQRALKACSEALVEAESLGFALYDPKVNDEKDQIDADVAPGDIYIPGLDKMAEGMANANIMFKDADGEDVEFDSNEFVRAVYKLRYLNTTTYNEGNHEIVWANNQQVYGLTDARLPRKVLQSTGDNQWREGWNGVAPTLYTVEHFLNADGTLPGTSSAAGFGISASQFYKPAGITDNKERERIVNVCLNREPRFYAWIGFDGGDYLTNLKDGEPCTLNMRNPDMQGHGQNERNYSATGFLSMKHVDPLSKWDGTNGTWTGGTYSPDVLIRLAELILNVAECQAEMDARGISPAADDTYNAGKNLKDEAIKNVNRIRSRAYVAPLTEANLGTVETRTSDGVSVTWDLVRWVRNERFIELWDEGRRYFDVRRWVAGDEYFGYGKRRGLNGLAVAPDENTFLTPIMINSQYTFHYRQYLYPIFDSQVNKNPQMVQNPGF